MTQLDLLTLNYPKRPGAKRSKASHESAERVTPSAEAIRRRVHWWLCSTPTGGTAETIATDLFDGDTNTATYIKFRNSVRSRLSELTADNKARRDPKLEPGATAHKYYALGAQ